MTIPPLTATRMALEGDHTTLTKLPMDGIVCKVHVDPSGEVMTIPPLVDASWPVATNNARVGDQITLCHSQVPLGPFGVEHTVHADPSEEVIAAEVPNAKPTVQNIPNAADQHTDEA